MWRSPKPMQRNLMNINDILKGMLDLLVVSKATWIMLMLKPNRFPKCLSCWCEIPVSMATCSELRRVLLNCTAILLSLSERKMSGEIISLSMIVIRDPPPPPTSFCCCSWRRNQRSVSWSAVFYMSYRPFTGSKNHICSTWPLENL